MTALLRSLSPDELALRLQQQELVAEFGLHALSTTDLAAVLAEASTASARGLQTPLAKVLRYRRDTDDFLVVSGVGWNEGVIGRATLPADSKCPAGYALQSRTPVIANDLAEETRFDLPPLLEEHGVQSAVNVVIGPVEGAAFGVLEVDSTQRRDFVAADTAFLQALANILAAAIARLDAEAAKDDLLREKDILMQEVHHRVKNSLQLVHTMLQVQAREAGPHARRPLDDAARRIMTISAVHHRLYAGTTVSQTNAGEFLQALLADMAPMLADPTSLQGVRLEAPSILLSADATTALGIVVSELVTNAVKYGRIPYAVRVENTPRGLLVTVDDDGDGFPIGFDPFVGTGLGMRLIATLANPAPQSITIDRSVRHGRISVLLRS